MRAKVTILSALTALFLIAASSSAYGSRPEVRCEAGPCSFAIAGGPQTFRFGRAEIGCEAIAGRGRFTSGTEGVAKLRFRRCREEVTPFRFSCAATGQPALPVRSNQMLMQTAAGVDRVPRIVFTNMKVRLACGIFRAFLEGGWIGRLDRGDCGVSRDGLEMDAAILGHADTGPDGIWDIYTDPGKNTYKLDGPWRLAFERSTKVRC